MKRILFLATFFVCSQLSGFAQFSGSGNGTEDDPYLIFNEMQLAQVSNFLNQEGVVFKLMKDLDIAEWISENNPNQGWLPIGVASSPFQGKFLGNNHKLSGLMIKRTSTDNVGFFGYVSGATIENLTIEGSSVKGASNVGGFIGSATGSEISNCNLILTSGVEGTNNVGGFIGQSNNTNFSTFTAKVSVTGQNYLGGFVGLADGGTWQQGNVEGQRTNTQDYTGGFAGKMSNVSLSDIKHIGDISGTDYTGGFVGCCSNATFIRCKVKSNIRGTQYVSGFAGALENTTSSFNYCFHEGTIMTTGDYAGGIVGVSKGGCIRGMESCSHFGDMIGENYVGGLIGAVVRTVIAPTLSTYTVYTEVSSNRPSGKLLQTTEETILNGSSENIHINNCVSIGNVEGNDWVGGIIGSEVPSAGYESNAITTTCSSYTSTKYLFKDRVYTGLHDYSYSGSTSLSYSHSYYRNTISCSLTNNYYSGTVHGVNNVGGLCGYKSGGNIQSNYAYANIYGVSNVGGIVGQTSSNSEWDSYNITTIKSNVANVSTISASNQNVGRIYGIIDTEHTVIGALGSSESNRALAQARVILSGVAQDIDDGPQNGTSIGPSALKLKANYVSWGWNFDEDWNILETESFPYKKYQAAPPVIESNLASQATSIYGKSVDGGTVYLYYKDRDAVSTECNNYKWSFNTEPLQSGAIVQIYADVEGMTPSYFTTTTVDYPGSGTEDDPWRIYTAEDLQGASNMGYYRVMNDIDLTAWIADNSPTKGWVPIGRNSGDVTYIDGDGHTISGLWINDTENYTGLFSNYSAGQIKNLNVEVAAGKKVKGGDYTGILIGRNANGRIVNCTVKGDVEGTLHVGGVVGYVEASEIKAISYDGKVTNVANDAYVGGLAGLTLNCSVTKCNVAATISATGTNSHVGGLIGNAIGGNISKSTSQNTLTATGTDNYVGGLVGYSETPITLCLTTGDVSATGNESYTGGLVGYALSSIENCYSTSQTTGTLFTGALVGYSFKSIDKCYAQGNVYGVMYGGGVVGELDGSNASLTNSIAANNILSLSAQSSWGSRVIGGYKNGAADPDNSNYALGTMQVSLNNVPQWKTDDIVEGIAKPASELMSAATYQGLGWDFSTVWGITEGTGYPYLRWELDINPVTEISLNKSTLLLSAGESETLTANIFPQNATNKNLTWTSSDESVATVENGIVTAVAVGTATITAAATDGSGVSATCEVTVTANKAEAIAQLQGIVDNAQSLYDNSTEGEDIGEYAPGSRAALLAVINDVRSRISSSMSSEEIRVCTADINAAVELFQGQKIMVGEDTDISALQNVIYIEKTDALSGTQMNLSIKMKNNVPIRSFQFDLYLPEGVTAATNAKGRILGALNDNRRPEDDEHTLTMTAQSNGAIRFLCGSQYDETFTGTDGEIATLTVNIADNMNEGDYPILLKSMRLSETNISNYYDTSLIKTTLTISNYTLGDIDGDGIVNVTDYTGVANHILGIAQAGFNAKAADVNSDNIINVSDYTGVANIILTGNIYGQQSSVRPRFSIVRKAPTDLSTKDNVIYVEPATLMPGTQAVLSLQMKNNVPVRSFQFDLYLPDGITAATTSTGKIKGSLNDGRRPVDDEHTLTMTAQPDGAIRFLCGSQYDETFTGTSGEIATLTVNIDNNMAEGEYPVILRTMRLSQTDISKYYDSDYIETTLTIGSNAVVLDEVSTSVPVATSGDMDITVRRTIKANEWSTICLPFEMTEAQVKAAFGDDVELADFESYDAEYDTKDNVTAITMNFADIDLASGMEANYPYMIRTKADISEFSVTATIQPDEDNALVEYDNGLTGKRRQVYGTFYGTIHANTTVPADALFLSANKFYYSKGLTKMKAFRAYFVLEDVLSDVGASSAIRMKFDDVQTGISEVLRLEDTDACYDVQGRRVLRPTNGVYILNGKKVYMTH